MSRIQKLENIYKEQLKDHKIKNVSNFIQNILNADITKGKYARFLIEAFINDKFLEEDLIGELDSTVGQAISLFDKHKVKLPIGMRSVYALNPGTGEALYQSPGDLWNNVKQFQGELSGKELKREEQDKVYRETDFIFKDEETGFQIISPLTEESAKWWGKGTRWCTSAEKNNRFWNYAKHAPLLILLMPDGNKLQLWKNDNNIQFMDDADNTVSKDYIKEHWSILEPICLWLNDLQFIPEELRTPELCKLAVQQNGDSLFYISKKHRTKELCELAVKQNGKSLIDVPLKYRTKELCELAVKKNGNALSEVPNTFWKKYRDYTMCLEAVKNNGWALQYVPDKCIDYNLCLEAVKQNGESIKHVPEENINYSLCFNAVKNNGLAIYYVPDELKTEELCKLAVKQNEKSFHYIPLELRTKELCELTIQQYEEALQHIEDEILKIPMDKYYETFQEIKTFSFKKDVSLSYHS